MATFVSRCREFRAVIKPTDIILDEARKPTVIRGKTILFKNGRYDTNDPDEIAFLMGHYARPGEFDVLPDEAIDARNRDVPMIEGALSVGASPESGLRSLIPEIKSPPHIVEDVTEKVMKAVDEKLATFASQILEVLKTAPPTYEKKKQFHCPVCGEEFKSGIQVGKHKKEAHPEPIEKKE